MANLRRDRRRARESALALLYSSDITETDAVTLVEGGAYPDDSVAVSAYAEQLVAGVTENLADIDAELATTSENWAIDRMPVVDRAILRIAVYEMVYVDRVPVSVAINEAVELAKLYGGEDESARFVNGVLGRIARRRESGEGSADSADLEQEAASDDADELDSASETPESALVSAEAGQVDANEDALESGEAPDATREGEENA